MRITEEMLASIIMETASKAIDEGIFDNDRIRNFTQRIGDKAREFVTGREVVRGEPTSASQVMSMCGWKGRVLKQLPDGVIMVCNPKTVGVGANYYEQEEMIEELNNYYQKHNLNLHAEIIGIDRGVIVKVTKQ